VLFVYSSADAAICQRTRERDLVRLREGLKAIAATVARGPAKTTQATIARRITRWFGQRAAAQFFRWEMVPWTEAERAALPPPARGCGRARDRFCDEFDEAAAAAAMAYDGLSALLTTAPRTHSGDDLFRQFKEQNYVELAHHQGKTPLAVRPVFLKSVQRVEALVSLMLIALTAYPVLERLYRQEVPAEAAEAEPRRTTESLLKEFAGYGLIARRSGGVRVVHAPRLTGEQRRVLRQLGFPTPGEQLAEVLALNFPHDSTLHPRARATGGAVW
jgi:hypothetical protein